MDNLTLPKKYLSYSQCRVWLDNKEQYRDIYYRGIKQLGSKYLLFGSEFAQGLEDGTINLPMLPQYQVQEFDVKVDIDGIPFHGWVDQYDPERHKFREIKTGSMRPDGKPRWTQELVNKHFQLDVYSLLIWLKTGKVDDECHLDWVKTTNAEKCITDFTGSKVCTPDMSKMVLTGEVESFTRIITQKDRDKARMLIRSIALEISSDYKAYLALSPSISPEAKN